MPREDYGDVVDELLDKPFKSQGASSSARRGSGYDYGQVVDELLNPKPPRKLELLLEAERRGILPQDKQALLSEMRKRGMIDEYSASAEKVLSDPDFYGLPAGEQKRVLARVDPGFKSIDPYAQELVLEKLNANGDEVVDVVDYANFRKEAQDMVEWAAEHPNLYGFYGAGKELKNTLKSAILNTPKSAGKMVSDIYAAVSHPVQTGKALVNVAEGAAQKFVPGEQEEEQYVDAIVDDIVARYGSAEGFQETVSNDPVGVLADLASIFMAGGTALKATGTATKAGRLAEAGKMLQQAGTKIEPLGLAGKGAGKVVQKAIPEGAPRKLYQQAAKFSTAKPIAERDAMAQLAVDKGIMPTYKGVDKARHMIDDLNEQISTRIDELTTGGAKIDSDGLFKYLGELKKDALLSDDPAKNVTAIRRIEKSIREGLLQRGSKKLTPKEMQTLKQRLYKAVNYENKPRSTRYVDLAKKQVARAAKEELEALYPEIKGLNADESALIKLYDAVQKSAARISNRDSIGIGVPIKMGTGAGAGGMIGGAAGATAGTFAGLVSGVLDSPRVKAALAVALNKAKRSKLKAKRFTAPVRNATVQAGRIKKGQERNER